MTEDIKIALLTLPAEIAASATTELKDDMVVLNSLMKEYKQEAIELANDCHCIDEEIANLTEVRNSLAKPHQDKLAELEEKMRPAMLTRAKTFICSFGKINFRKGAVRRSWNLDALDQSSGHPSRPVPGGESMSHSFYDRNMKLYVDCTECERGINGVDKDKCSAGWKHKRPGLGCFCGTLIKGIIATPSRGARA